VIQCNFGIFPRFLTKILGHCPKHSQPLTASNMPVIVAHSPIDGLHEDVPSLLLLLRRLIFHFPLFAFVC
jgi:hypothetical protein